MHTMSDLFVVEANASSGFPSSESRQTDAHVEPGVTWRAAVVDNKRRMIPNGEEEGIVQW